MLNNTANMMVFQSNYSLLTSAITISDAVKYAQDEQLTALILADRNVLSGGVAFYDAAMKANIIAHIGMEIYLGTTKMLAIAKNNQGYQSLLQASSLLNSKEVSEQQVYTVLKDLIIVFETAEETVINELKIKPTLDCYMRTQTQLAKQADYFAMPTIDFPIINCLAIADRQILEVLQAISENKEIVNLTQRIEPEIARNITGNIPAILTKKTVIFDFSKTYLPRYSEDTELNDQLFYSLCQKGIRKRYGELLRAEHMDRLQYEMQVIKQMGFVDYFLIIWDVMRFARTQDIIIGPGRGSAVGSIVAYVMGITMIDPLAYNLIFERFLNIERKSLPDIDIDIEDGRRGEIVAYLREKYGAERVANIGTFGTFGAKSSVRDVAKAFGLDALKINNVVKQLRNSTSSIAVNIKENQNLQQILAKHPEIANIVEIAQKIEGFPRHTSMHAAGVIITNDPTIQHTATIEVESGVFVTQLAMGACERVGLLKIDFLGLRNLTIIRRIAERVSTSETVGAFINTIPNQDTTTFEMLTTGETTGIFQLESNGMRRVLRQFKITSFMDIATVLALYRPGPMQFIDEYIARKNNNKPYTVEIPEAREVLADTYGIMVYQEQVMKLAQVIGGMSLAEADLFRRAMGKKDEVLLKQQQERFLAGAKKKAIQAEAAAKLFAEILAFANYGFNKSHAIAYAEISYQMAYLKTHYTAVFMTELINSVLNNEKKVYEYMHEAGRFGIKLLPPDIQKSDKYFTVESPKEIRMGFLAIKGIGKVAVEHVLTIRQEKPFSGLGDFLTRTEVKAVNTTTLRQLANAYAFSGFSKNQKSVHQFIEIHEQGRKFQGVAISNEIPRDVDDYTLIERRQLEQEAFGFSFFAHPLLGYPVNNNSLIEPPQRATKYIVIIDRVKEITTKQGKKMAFVTISDLSDQAEVVIFPDTYSQCSPFVKQDKIVEVLLRQQVNYQGEVTKNVIKVSPYIKK